MHGETVKWLNLIFSNSFGDKTWKRSGRHFLFFFTYVHFPNFSRNSRIKKHKLNTCWSRTNSNKNESRSVSPVLLLGKRERFLRTTFLSEETIWIYRQIKKKSAVLQELLCCREFMSLSRRSKTCNSILVWPAGNDSLTSGQFTRSLSRFLSIYSLFFYFCPFQCRYYSSSLSHCLIFVLFLSLCLLAKRTRAILRCHWFLVSAEWWLTI
jgi:hypothetical protein